MKISRKNGINSLDLKKKKLKTWFCSSSSRLSWVRLEYSDIIISQIHGSGNSHKKKEENEK